MSDLPTPNDRVESLLMAILTGDGSDLPTAKTRTEKLLLAIYENGSAGGGGTGGVTPAQVKTILLANTDTALNGTSSNPIANKTLVATLADYVKSADLSIPTKVSELTNDKKYQTDTDVANTLTPYAKSDDVTAEIIAEIAKVVADAPEDLNTLKEIADWIAGHKDDASAMNSAISDNKTAITALQTDKADKSEIPSTVAELTDSANYATKDEIPTVPSKVSELTNDNNYQTEEQVNSAVTTEIAKVVADAPEDFNTLKEMSDWIAGHEDDASAMNSAISDNKTAIAALQTGKADKSEIPTSLPADGGNADTVNNHTVETDVPADAVFTDTIYDDTEVKGSIDELNSNLDTLEYSDVVG